MNPHLNNSLTIKDTFLKFAEQLLCVINKVSTAFDLNWFENKNVLLQMRVGGAYGNPRNYEFGSLALPITVNDTTHWAHNVKLTLNKH